MILLDTNLLGSRQRLHFESARTTEQEENSHARQPLGVYLPPV